MARYINALIPVGYDVPDTAYDDNTSSMRPSHELVSFPEAMRVPGPIPLG